MNGPDRFAHYLEEAQYHPRSDQHSNALCNILIEDLINACPEIAQQASRGEIVARVNFTQTIGHNDWVIDLAIGTPSDGVRKAAQGEVIRRAFPAIIRIAIELKAIMTEHGKTRKNRFRDFQAFHDHAHNYDPKTIAAGLLTVNASPKFWSPLRQPQDITEHRNVNQVTRSTVELFKGIPLRSSASAPAGMEAIGVIVIGHDNLKKHPDAANRKQHLPTRIKGPPLGPAPGSPIHYETMLQRICNAYRDRF